MSFNTEQARQNMVENQVRTWEVLDDRALDTLRSVRREDFVPTRHRNLAFADLALPIGHGEVTMKPVIEGRILQTMALKPSDRVLEIGTGSGFLTACLAHLCAHVTSVEQHADLATDARAKLAAAEMRNVEIETADALAGYQPRGPFDVVVVGGAVYSLPDVFRGWVAKGGRLFAIVGESPAMQATLYTRVDETRWQSEAHFETDLPYLHRAEPPRRFTL